MANDPDDDRWTIGRLLAWTADYLKRRGSESPRLDAEVLLAFALRRERVQLYTKYDEEVAADVRAAFRDLVRRRAEGMPVAYLVGKKEFYSLALAVTPDVLIPRPDTEFVVVTCLDALKGRDDPLCLDVGTGSGCIALACVKHHPSARFLSVDLSPAALAIARSNAESLGLADRIEFFEGDLLGPIGDRGPFALIASNPPYIPTDAIEGLEPGVRDYEPRLALDGGPSGLDLARRLIDQAAPRLEPGGHLVLEIGDAQEAPIRDYMAARPELTLRPTIRDLANHPRVVHAERRAD